MSIFYVSTSGDDTNSGTDTTVPWRSIATGAGRLLPGDTLLVRGGTYDENITYVSPGLSWTQKVRIAAYPNETVLLQPTTPTPAGFIIWIDANTPYIEFDGINLDGSLSGQSGFWASTNNNNDPHHIRYQNADIQVSDYSSYGAGIRLGGSGVATGGYEIFRVHIHGGGYPSSSGIDLLCSNNQIIDCQIYDTVNVGILMYTGGGAGFTPDNNIIANCGIYNISRYGDPNFSWGILCYGNNNQIYNNLLFNLTAGSQVGIIAVYTGNKIWNNTIYNATGVGIKITYATDTVVQNNIVYQAGVASYTHDNDTGTIFDHNITDVDPVFVDASGGNFHLDTGSPGLDTGITINSFATDKDSVIRPQGTAWDIGAYEKQTEVIVGGSRQIRPQIYGPGTNTKAAYGAGTDPTIIHVTNLLDDGLTGSLRFAVESSGPRVVVFDISGMIDLVGPLFISNPYITIAGQTAPSPGITLRYQPFVIQTHDVMLQHFRIRSGWVGNNCNNAIIFYPAGTAKAVVLDHLSISWGQNENIVMYPGIDRMDCTIWRCIISEGLRYAPGSDACFGQASEGRGMSVLANTIGVAIFQSLFAHNYSRTPFVQNNDYISVINNLFYNWGQTGGALTFAELSGAVPPGGPWKSTVVGNRFVRGPNSTTGGQSYTFSYYDTALSGNDRIYRHDNTIGNNDGNVIDQFISMGYDPNQTTEVPEAPIPTNYPVMDSMTVEDFVTKSSGCRPTDRDPVDVRVVAEVVNRGGFIIATQDSVGGWPTLASATVTFVPVSSPHVDSGNGYTNLEMQLETAAQFYEHVVPTSADRTCVPGFNSITDANGDVWTMGTAVPFAEIIVNGNQLIIPGPIPIFGSEILWFGGMIYVKGDDDNWYSWDGSTFTFIGPTAPASCFSNGVMLTGVTRSRSNGNPLPGARVYVFRTSDNVLVASTTSDLNGAFSANVAPNIEHYIVARYQTGGTHLTGTTSNHLVGGYGGGQLIYAGNLHYVGAFRLPQYPIRYDANAKGIAYSGNNSLYVVGKQDMYVVGEVSIPSPLDANAPTIVSLPIATEIQSLTDPTAGHWFDLDNPGAAVVYGGLLVYNNKLYLAANRNYDAGSPPGSLSHFVCNMNLTYVSGPHQVGDAHHAGIRGGYMGTIPTTWQTSFGGYPCMTGLTAENIVTRTSQGPTATGFNPSLLGVVVPVPGTQLVNYPDESHALGGLGYTITSNDHLSHPDYNQTFIIGGIVFPDGWRSVLFIGSIGIGPTKYGLGTSTLALDGIEVYTVTGDPGDIGVYYCYDPVNPAKGGHAYPYVTRVWAYDANDIASVVAGTVAPYAINPYSMWTLTVPFNSYWPRIAGVAWDAAGGRLFISQFVADGDAPLIHVFTLDPGTSTPLP